MLLTRKRLPKQQGAALLVSLMFLLILTILGVSTMQSTVMEEKMAGNNNDYNRAFQAAEAGLRGGENWLSRQPSKPAPLNNGSSGVYSLNALYDDTDTDPAGVSEWWQQKATLAEWSAIANVNQFSAINNATGGVNTSPYYIIEENAFIKDNLNVGAQGDNTGRNLYRITARGTGGVDTTRVSLQTTYSKRF